VGGSHWLACSGQHWCIIGEGWAIWTYTVAQLLIICSVLIPMFKGGGLPEWIFAWHA